MYSKVLPYALHAVGFPRVSPRAGSSNVSSPNIFCLFLRCFFSRAGSYVRQLQFTDYSPKLFSHSFPSVPSHLQVLVIFLYPQSLIFSPAPAFTSLLTTEGRKADMTQWSQHSFKSYLSKQVRLSLGFSIRFPSQLSPLKSSFFLFFW